MNKRVAGVSIGRYIYLYMRKPTSKPPRQPRSYTPLSDALSQPLTFADTELAEGLQRHSLAGLLRAAISLKRRSDGEPCPTCSVPCWSGPC